MNCGSNLLPFQNTEKGAFLTYIEYYNGDGALFAESESRCIHDLEMVHQALIKGKGSVFLCRGVLHGIRVIYTVHLGPLEKCVRAYLQGTKGSTGIGREERIAGSARYKSHPAPFQKGYGVFTGIVSGYWGHIGSREDFGLQPFRTQGRTERKGIYHRGQHPHAVSGDSVIPFVKALKSAENVSAPVHNGNLVAFGAGRGNLGGESFEAILIQTFSGRASQALSAQFQ